MEGENGEDIAIKIPLGSARHCNDGRCYRYGVSSVAALWQHYGNMQCACVYIYLYIYIMQDISMPTTYHSSKAKDFPLNNRLF